MNLKRVVNYQRLFLLIFLVMLIEKGLDYYLPWLKAISNESFVLFKESKLNFSDNNFNETFIIKTFRFLSLILLIIPLFYYNKFLINIKTKTFFAKENNQLLIKSSVLLVSYAFINYVLNYLDIERHYFNLGFIVFIAISSYMFGIIFKQVYCLVMI